MGYFNRTSLGDISSVTTNTMELLGDVATRVVMQTTQGLLNTALILLMLLIFDWRIGLIALIGALLFALINARMQHNNEALSGQKIANDTKLIENVLEYIQGISEVKSYGLSGESEQKLKDSIAESARLMTDLEFASNRYMPLQNGVLKLTGLGISGRKHGPDHRGADDGHGLSYFHGTFEHGRLLRAAPHGGSLCLAGAGDTLASVDGD